MLNKKNLKKIKKLLSNPECSRNCLDCKTARSFARSPKIGVFERVLTRGREMGERGEEGVARPGEKGKKKTIFGLLAKEGAVLQSRNCPAMKIPREGLATFTGLVNKIFCQVIPKKISASVV